ncbi:hypothetical protein EBB07_23510 [Paenibacillaceae bacterium]|nr:hypothetical protein EBB07_23510 [Paenibacillaceae bacterium]
MEYYLEASSGQQHQTVGTAASPIALKLVADEIGPVMSEETPENGAKVENKPPDIAVKVYDPSGIDDSSVKVEVNGSEVAAKYHPAIGKIVAEMADELAVGVYTVKVTVQDRKHNQSDFTWSFEVLKTFAGGNHYRGSTHNHTEISHDAQGSPASAIEAAKKHRYDWFAFTDHSHDIDVASRGSDSVNHNGMPERTGNADEATSEWQKLQKVVDNSTVDGSFVALRSYEMTSTVWGHSNIFGTENFIDRVQDGGIYQNLSQFYKWAKTRSELVGQFNHPNWGASSPPFNGFLPYDKDIDGLFTMFELGNGSGQYTYANIEDLYFKTLELGWHIAPTFGEDHHNGSWGETMRRTIVVAEELTEEALLHAMRNRRVYMSESPHFTLDMQANGFYMGSIVDSQSLRFAISGRDSGEPYTYLPANFKPDERIKMVELITNGSKVVETITPGRNPANFADNGKSFTWEPQVQVAGGQQWFVVKVTQMDGNRTYSSPVWSKEVEVDVKVQGIEVAGGSIIAGNAVHLEALIGNFGNHQLNNLKVKFYYDQVDDSHLIGEAEAGPLPSKTTARTTIVWNSPVAGDHTLIAALVNPPDGNAPANNLFETAVHVKEPLGITVMVDASHGNENSAGDSGTYRDNLKTLTKLLRDEGYSVMENQAFITRELLENVAVFMISQPAGGKPYTEEEQQILAAYVNDGGSILLTGKSNNSANSQLNNPLLASLGSVVQFNHDGVYDDSKEGNFWSNPAASLWAVRAHPEPVSNYVTDFVRKIDYFSGASLMKTGKQALTDLDPVTIIARGNKTSYQYNLGAAGFDYDAQGAADGEALPLIASQQIGKGRIVVAGMNVFNDRQMSITEDNNHNLRLARNVFNWLANRETVVLPISEARKQPVNSDIVVEGKVTSAAGVFFDAFHIQDATGGIMAFNEVPAGSLQLGDTVRVYGHVKIFENNLEIMFDHFDNNVLKLNKEPGIPVEPLAISTGKAAANENQGMLVKLTGKVTKVDKIPDHTIYIDDGSGEALVFIDGYIAGQSGHPPELKVGDTLEAVGLVGKFSGGNWVRVRNTKELRKLDAPPTPGGSWPYIGAPGASANTGSDKPGTVTVREEQLAHSEGGTTVIKVPDDAIEIIFPANTAELLSDNRLEVRTEQLAVTIPASVFRQLAGKLTAAERAGGKISLKLQPLGAAESDRLRREAEHANDAFIQLAGHVYEFSMAIHGAGRSEKVSSFDEPIVLRLKVGSNIKPQRLGIYHISKDGVLEYAGGDYSDGYMAAEISHFSYYAVLEAVKQFADLPVNHWASAAIEELTARRIVNGTGGTSFEPNSPVSRAEFTALLVRALQLDERGANVFTDVPEDSWFAAPIAIAYHSGLVRGKSRTEFDPNGRITREQMVIMLVNAYELLHGKVTADTGLQSSFKDMQLASPWAVEAIRTASQLGLMQGRGAGQFKPQGSASRAEAAQVIYNLLKNQ